LNAGGRDEEHGIHLVPVERRSVWIISPLHLVCKDKTEEISRKGIPTNFDSNLVLTA